MSQGRNKPPKVPKPLPQNLRGTAPGTFVLMQSSEFGDEVREVLYRRDEDRPTRQTYNVPTARLLLLQGEPGSPPRTTRGPVIGRDPGESDGGTIVVPIERSHWPDRIARAIRFYESGGELEPEPFETAATMRIEDLPDEFLIPRMLDARRPEEAEEIAQEIMRRMREGR